VLKESTELVRDSRKKCDGMPLRQSWALPFLSKPTSASVAAEKTYCLYESQISVAITGIDHWVWTAYGFVDTYFGSKESVDGYDRMKGPTGRPDPLALGRITSNNRILTPREYFLKIFEFRMNEVRRQWHVIIDKVDGDINQLYQYVQCIDFSGNIPSDFES
jgi:hypothetical protein